MPRESAIRAAGLVITTAYAVVIGSFIGAEPRTFTEALGSVTSGIGVYRIDERAFADGLGFFYKDQFAEARDAFARADPARRDARTQFYIAYSFYRQGWRRTHSDDELFRQGLAALDHAQSVAPGGRIVVEDENLQMRSAEELRAELEDGLRRDASDFNPMRWFETRK